MIAPPSSPTWARWRRLLACPGSSQLRLLEYEVLREIPLRGVVLDVGGGGRSSYNGFFHREARVVSVNLDPAVAPTVRADFNWGLPFASASVEAVVSFNTLEHVRADEALLKEMARVLKPGGVLHLSVPFLYQIHASPGDYHRRTAQFWSEALSALHFPSESVVVQPLVFGGLSAPLSLVEMSLPPVARAALRALLLAPVWVRRPGRRGLVGTGEKTPLGYFISAVKSGAPAEVSR